MLLLTGSIAANAAAHWFHCCRRRCCCLLPPGSRDWQRPDKTLRPAGTVALEGGVACETDFEDCGEDVECDVEIAGAKVPLQRVSITLPPNTADAGGLTFVLRR
jgi:alpha-glucan,water dikinase